MRTPTMPQTTYVLTGSNRGIGLEFVRQLSSSPDNVLFAGVRSLSGDLADLKSLISSAKATVHLLECDTSSRDSILNFASRISKTLSSSQKASEAKARVDYLLNIAGINDNASVPILAPQDTTGQASSVPSSPITADMLNAHMSVNVLGPLILASALEPLLQSGSVVLNMTSGLGSLTNTLNMSPRKCPVYSASKAALDLMTLHLEGEFVARGKSVVCVVVDPGWVKTRMGGDGAVLEPEESVGGMLRLLGKLEFEGGSGRFWHYSGSEIPW